MGKIGPIWFLLYRGGLAGQHWVQLYRQTDIQADTVLGCYDGGGWDGCGVDVDGGYGCYGGGDGGSYYTDKHTGRYSF